MTAKHRRETVDKDLDKLVRVEEALAVVARTALAPGIALVFLVAAALIAALASGTATSTVFLIAASVMGAYMALAIGANDVANNVGPAVGARIMTMGGALAMAALFECAGALLAGGNVVETVSRGIVSPEAIGDPRSYMNAMMASLIAAAVWVHLATWLRAPVSTTHSIIGGVLGAGIATSGFAAASWTTVTAVSASWILSPLAGGIVAALCLALVNTAIVYRDDRTGAARRWVPILVGLMGGAFAAFLATTALARVAAIGPIETMALAIGAGLVSWSLSRRSVVLAAQYLDNRSQSLRQLFTAPLIAAAALLSFAHGANDVANAVGPLAAIYRAAQSGIVADSVIAPFWIMLVGAGGISLGLLLFGRRIVEMVGKDITRLNPIRAFCVALASAITVLFASFFGMPVSSTHVAIGAVFGVGFFREWYLRNSQQRRGYVARNNAAHKSTPHAPRPRAREVPAPERHRRRLVRRAYVTAIVSRLGRDRTRDRDACSSNSHAARDSAVIGLVSWQHRHQEVKQSFAA